jgi:dihydroorotase
MAGSPGRPTGIGRPVDLDLTRAWLVDPFAEREGPADVVVRGGVIEALTWLAGDAAAGADDRGVIVAPGFLDLHVHLREPGNPAAETTASGLAAAAHGGFTTVCAMANTTPAADHAAILLAERAAAAASGSPVRLLTYGTVTAGRSGEALAALGELADGGAIGFSDDGSPVASPSLFRNALAYAGMLGRPLIEHPEDPTLSAGAEANDGLVATVLGLKGWPASAEAVAVARDLAILRDVLVDVPTARLHLTHLSTGESLEHVRLAKSAGLPVTCDVTPHHLALTEEWLAGARRFAWQAIDDGGRARDPWRDGALVAPPFDPVLRVNPPLRSPVDAAACLAALVDGTADAIVTDHAPHAAVDKAVEFGLAANGISGLETALGVLLEAVDAGRLSLGQAIAALTAGPARILASWGGAAAPRLAEGETADLVVFDRSERWRVAPETLLSRGKNSPLLGRELPGRVLLTVAGGRLAHGPA